jgi:hypothetical protein
MQLFYTKTRQVKYRKKDRRTSLVGTPICFKRAFSVLGIGAPASATLEAALVLPLYIYAVLAVTYLLQILNIKAAVRNALYEDVRQLSRYAVVAAESKTVSSVMYEQLARKFLLENLSDSFFENSGITGGKWGISFGGSSFLKENNEITVRVTYYLKNPFDIFGIGKTKISQQFTGRAWLGETTAEYESTDEKKVYITQEGSVYHESKSCSYLNLSIVSISFDSVGLRRNADGSKYYACEQCAGGVKPSTVYITSYGNRYHTDRNCSGLKRSVFCVPLSEASDRRACKKCGKGE